MDNHIRAFAFLAFLARFFLSCARRVFFTYASSHSSLIHLSYTSTASLKKAIRSGDMSGFLMLSSNAYTSSAPHIHTLPSDQVHALFSDSESVIDKYLCIEV